MNIYINFTL